MNRSSRTRNLAAQIAKEMLRPDRRVIDTACFVCGRLFLPKLPINDDNTGRFCSTRCRQAYDAGYTPGTVPNEFTTAWRVIAGSNPGHVPQPVRAGRHGFLITCPGCGKEFNSCGLHFCSTDCERQHRRRNETATLMQSVGMELPTKRKCKSCGGDIPNWRGEGKARKRLRSDARFCSLQCSQRSAARNRRSRWTVGTPLLHGLTIKRPP